EDPEHLPLGLAECPVLPRDHAVARNAQDAHTAGRLVSLQLRSDAVRGHRPMDAEQPIAVTGREGGEALPEAPDRTSRQRGQLRPWSLVDDTRVDPSLQHGNLLWSRSERGPNVWHA